MSKHCRLCNDEVQRRSKYCLRHMIDMYSFRDSVNRGTLKRSQAEASILASEKADNEKLSGIFELKSFLNVNAQGW